LQKLGVLKKKILEQKLKDKTREGSPRRKKGKKEEE